MALSRRSGGPRRRSRFTLVLLVLTSITVLTLDFRGSGAVDGARGGASTVFGPVRDVGAAIGRPFANAWNGVFGYGDLATENEALRERLEQLGAEVTFDFYGRGAHDWPYWERELHRAWPMLTP